MALIKSDTVQSQSIRSFSTLREALDAFKVSQTLDEQEKILEQALAFDGGAKELVKLLKERVIEDKKLMSHVGALLSGYDAKKAPIEEIMELLKLENAFLRNLAISILQDYGQEIKYYIVKFLIGDDRDLRIFAINVLGDVNFKESRDMLVELLGSEEDVNVAMTAVDYLAEIGEPEDIQLLENLKERFRDEPYVEFAINRAIKMIRG